MFWLFSKNKNPWLFSHCTEKYDIIRDVMYRAVKDFVENDKAFSEVVWTEDEKHKKIKSEFEKIYDWIVDERPLLEDKLHQLEDNYPVIPDDVPLDKFVFVSEKHLEEVFQLQEQIWNTDQHYLKTIIDIRDYLFIL